jgi:hypothetical protein
MSIKEEIRDELRANQIPEEFVQDCADKILALFSVSQAERPVCPCYCDMWLEPNEQGEIFCSCGKKV